MNENINPYLEPEHPLDDPQTIEGLADLSGPAAFKARQKVDQPSEGRQEDPQEETNAIVEDLTAKLAAAQDSLAQTNDQLLRTIADMDNLRKRSVREREDAGKYAIASFAKDLLDVADTFQRALLSIPADLRNDARINPLIQGIEATERSLLSCFEKSGIKKVDPLDIPFDPNFHEVMFEAPVPGKAAGIIIQVIEPGYIIHDRLLRPARVGVAKSAPNDGSPHVIDTQA